MNQKCTSCKVDKPLSEFNKNKSKRSGYSNICRECSKKKSKKYYSDNKEEHKSKVKNNKKKLLKENRLKLIKYLKENPCVDCGEKDFIVLQFDHIDPNQKTYEISVMLNAGYKWDTIKSEIKKCEVRCANCHIRRTSEQQNWYSYI